MRRRGGFTALSMMAWLVTTPAHAQVDGSVMIRTLGGDEGFGRLHDPDAPLDIAEAFPDGLRLFDAEATTTVYLNAYGNMSFHGPIRGYNGRLPRLQPREGVRGRIILFEATAYRGGGAIYVDQQPSSGPDQPARLIATWHRMPDRPSEWPDARYVSAQLVITAGTSAADYDVEWRYGECGWIEGDGLPEALPIVGFDSGTGRGGAHWAWPGSGTRATARLCDLSNAQVAGLYRYEVRDGLPSGCGIDADPPPGDGRCADDDYDPGDGCSAACWVEPDVDEDGFFEAPWPGLSVDPDGIYDDCDATVDPSCDNDEDGDGVLDGADNCPTVANPIQRDYDGDLRGDACDADDDDDGLPDADGPGVASYDVDLCPQLFSLRPPDGEQLDSDGDGDGDQCDPDDDGDGVSDCGEDGICRPDDNGADDDRDSRFDEAGECLGAQAETEGCTRGDRDLFDNDGDGAVDEADEIRWARPRWPGPDRGEDNCRAIPNPDQFDRDGDGVGDACDPIDDPTALPSVTRVPDAPTSADPSVWSERGQRGASAPAGPRAAVDVVDDRPAAACDIGRGGRNDLNRTRACPRPQASCNAAPGAPASGVLWLLPALLVRPRRARRSPDRGA